MRPKLAFEEWEIAFIILTYAEFGPNILLEYLNKPRTTFYRLIRKLKINKCGHREKIYIGQIFNDLTVKGFDQQDKQGRRFYHCLCKCGNMKSISVSSLISGNSIDCGCVNRSKGKVGLISNWYIGKYRTQAKIHGREFQLTKEYLWEIFQKQNGKCALTGIDLKFASTARSGDGNASIDRIDSSKDYIEGNIQWVHKDINYMKQEYDQEYFINMCNLITKKHTKENQ